MGIRNSFKYKDVEKKLKGLLCKKLRNCIGSHEIWYSPLTNKEFPVVNHGSDNMKIKTLKEMLKHAGISEDDFLNE